MTSQSIQSLDPWDDYPKIDLYMDQVLNIVNRQLAPYFKDPKDGTITASMVNNYVKQGLLPRPEKKKYRPQEVTRLVMIGILKQVLTIAQIMTLLDLLLDEKEGSEAQLYTAFRDSLDRSFESIWSKGKGPLLPQAQEVSDILDLALISFLTRFEATSLLEELVQAGPDKVPAP